MPGMRRNDSPPVRRGFAIREFKTLDDAQGTFSGYLAVFGVEDQVWADPLDKGDIIEPGAFTKTLQEMGARQQSRAQRGLPSGRYMLPIFWAHLSDEPIGGFTALREDATGLYFEAELDMDIPQGQRAYSGLKAGYIPGMSFGYFAVRAAWDREGRRHLKEVSVFEGTVTSIPMSQGAEVLEIKSASDDDKKAQAARAKKYGIAAKDGGNVTKPSQWANLSDADFGDPVNYRYPMPDKAHADDAAARFGAATARSAYSSKEQGIIDKRIAKRQASFGESESEDGSKGKSMTRRPNAARQAARQAERKARTFEQVFNTDREAYDILEDLDDLWCALRESLLSVLIEGANNSGDNATASESLDQFSTAVMSWLEAAEMQQCWADIADAADDAQGDAADYALAGIDTSVKPSYYYMALNTASAEAKAGRAISQANADAMQKSLDMLADAHKAAAKGIQMARAGHKALSNLYAKMQPGAAQDKDDGDSTDDDGDGGGDGDGDEGKSLNTTGRAPGASGTSTTQSDTTQQQQQQQQQLSADELGQLIRERLAASLAAGNKQSA